jgi:Cu/Ag efflux protein CusF
MKRAMLTVMVLAISVIFVAAVMAAEQKAPASPASAPAAPKFEKYSGVVEKVDSAKKDFSVKSGKEEMTFSWTDKTKITEGKKGLSFTGLEKGQEVTVEYTKEGNKSVAQSVSVSPPKTVGMKGKTPSTTKK